MMCLLAGELGSGLSGLGFGLQGAGLGFRVQGSGLGFRAQGLGLTVWGLWFLLFRVRTVGLDYAVGLQASI